MLDELPKPDPPQWLTSAWDPQGPLPINEMLDGSVFYPACDVDGDPVKYLGGNFHSFIYVDYGTGRRRLQEELETFRGYRVVGSRPVLEKELIPNGWMPRFPTGYAPRRRPPDDWVKHPFAEWVVYERLAAYPPTHGPQRFSLLYVGGEGAASFQALYHGNIATPAVVAVIRPGTGFGGNWTDFRARSEILAWSVLDAFPDQRPRWLVDEGPGNACWQEFQHLVKELRPGLRLWEREAP
jgi:hypothetical protein